jgi:hypothetical protein
MKNKKKLHKDGGSISTFFVYSAFVLIFILISLSIKAIYIFKQNKFDGKNFIITVSQGNKAVGIIGFDTSKKSISLLNIKNSNIATNEVGRKIGLVSNAELITSENVDSDNIEIILSKTASPNKDIKSDLTIFDSLRLAILSKSIQDKDREHAELDQIEDENEIDRIVSDLFKDNTITTENLSIQIINTTNIPGLGKQLERVIVNQGGNVISVTNSRESVKKSKIQYVGEKNYTVEKFISLFDLSAEKIENRAIADVVIIIGEDYKNIKAF